MLRDRPIGCPPDTQLAALATGRPPDESVAKHVSSCARCQQQLEDIRSDDAFMAEVLGEHGDGCLAETSPGGPREPLVGDTIGPFRIVECLGEGAMGVVYRAEQAKPLQREVAIKVVKMRSHSSQMDARFEFEQQALALMDHPNIAKVIEAGITPTGLPYFVMEHIRGVPITEHCDQHRLPIPERIALFMKVCDAIQHAHQKGVIHRDLKPSNILVALDEREGVPKIIDFGVAKAAHHLLPDRPFFTEQGQIIGTPAYMSPEQAGVTAQDVDTRADVYSLGVLLYELLTGALPFDPKMLQQAGLLEAQRIIREDDPPKPSERLRGPRSAAEKSARCRAVSVRSLRRRVRGDLDCIVMKALQKDRVRRHATASGLARDLRRHLEHEPVVPPSPMNAPHRLRKFVRRHRSAVAVAALLGLVTAAGLAATSWEASQASVAAASEAKARNETQGLRLLLETLLRHATPGDMKMLGAAADTIADEFNDQPLVEADLRKRLADTYYRLGHPAEALGQFERAFDLRRGELGDRDLTTLETARDVAILYKQSGRLAAAEDLNLKAIEDAEHVEGGEPLALILMGNLANVYVNQGRHDEAVQLYLDVIDRKRQTLDGGERHEETLISMNNLARLEARLGRHADAWARLSKTIELAEDALGHDHRRTVVFRGNRPLLLIAQGRLGEAEAPLRASIEEMARVFGEESSETLSARRRLARLYVERESYQEAEHQYERILESQIGMTGLGHPQALVTLLDLLDLLLETGRLDEAWNRVRWGVAEARSALPDDDRLLGRLLAHRGAILVARREYDAARDALIEAHGILISANDARAADTALMLADTYAALGQPEMAKDWRRRAGVAID